MRNVPAMFNWGRWVAWCPDPSCFGATELEQGQATFVCQCVSAKACDHGFKKCGQEAFVSWPPDPAEIKRLCDLRPPRNRNWNPGESLEDLRRENREHGVPI